MKVLYIGRELQRKICDGGSYVSLKNREMLLGLYGKSNVAILEIPKVSACRHLINILLRRGYGYTARIKYLLKGISKENFDFCFVDGTHYGRYVDDLAKSGCKVIVFCHNVEYDYYTIKYRIQRSFANLLMKEYIHFNERLAISRAHTVIALNERDAIGIKRYYKRCPELLLPISYSPIPENKLLSCSIANPYILFVGAGQIANIEGITWFIKHVSRHLNISLCVAGACCTSLEKWCFPNEYPNVVLKGFVDNLDELYINASAVICPIFSGSGMKTKTIEALRYGKRIFGTVEAFEGIEADFREIGGLCNSSEDYVLGILNMKQTTFNKYSYEVFMKSYSDNIVHEKFNRFVNNANNGLRVNH
ncbi:glycosyltransferase [Bacteroides clarus]|uniref:glycosyltransferase n=1 Tax=Bacteroides clarus TaxID=626929 RepID=UPI00189742E7|nr:glycosyltransferase [Bacteroides clarus]